MPALFGAIGVMNSVNAVMFAAAGMYVLSGVPVSVSSQEWHVGTFLSEFLLKLLSIPDF